MSKRVIQQVIDGQRKWCLIDGDCLDLFRRVPDQSIDSIIVDPPYGMSYQGKGNKLPKIMNDERPFIWWLYDAFRVLKEGGALVCFCQWRGQEDFKRAIEVAGFNLRSQVIWDRKMHGMGDCKSQFAPQHDVIWFAVKGRGFAFPHGRPKSVIPAMNVPANKRLHSTQKPDELMRYLVEKVTPVGGVVLDPCAGSGSTGEAALRIGYRFIGFELDPVNVITTRQRLSKIGRPGNIKGFRAGGIKLYPSRVA